jgi:hypothetical protein
MLTINHWVVLVITGMNVLAMLLIDTHFAPYVQVNFLKIHPAMLIIISDGNVYSELYREVNIEIDIGIFLWHSQ